MGYKKMKNNVPKDYKNPEWKNPGRVHEWKNHVGDEIRKLWNTFTNDQKAAIAYEMQLNADAEE